MRPTWGIKKYVWLQLIIIATAAGWPSVVLASSGKDFAHAWAWELIVGSLLFAVPFGAWLGVSIPPPSGYEDTGAWSFAARYLSGLIVGYSAAIILASSVTPLAATVVPPAVLAAVAGPSLIVILRARLIKSKGAR